MSTANGSAAAKRAAARARVGEVKGQAPMTFDHLGVTYTIDKDAANDLELMEALEDEKYLKGIRGFLGTEQWATFKDSVRGDDGRVPVEAAEPFLTKMLEVIGQGNSSASPTS